MLCWLRSLVRAGKEGCVPWLVAELGNAATHWCTRAELAAVLGSLARIPALSAAMVRAHARTCQPLFACIASFHSHVSLVVHHHRSRCTGLRTRGPACGRRVWGA